MSETAEKFVKFITNPKFYGPIITILVAMIVYYIVSSILNKVVIKGKDDLDKKRKQTIIQLFQNIVKYLTLIIVFLIILELFGVDTKNLIAGLGIAGLVIGLAMQDTIKDIIAGVNIIMDNYYVVGDTIEYKGFKGEVIALGLRTTKIKKYSGEVQTFANRNIDLVINYSQKNSNQIFKIATDYDIKIEKVEKIIEKLIPKVEEVDNVIKGKTKYLGVTDTTATNVNHISTLECKRMTQYEVRREIVKILKEEFDKKKIKVIIS